MSKERFNDSQLVVIERELCEILDLPDVITEGSKRKAVLTL